MKRHASLLAFALVATLAPAARAQQSPWGTPQPAPQPPPPPQPPPAPEVAQPAPPPPAAQPLPPPPPAVMQPAYAPNYVYVPTPRRVVQAQPYDGGTVPPGMHVEERPRRGLTITGGVLFGVSYGISATIGLLGLSSRSSSSNGLGWFAVPVLGPAIWSITSNSDSDSVGVVYATLDTVVQGAALAMWIYGALNPSRVLVPDGYANARPRWMVTPGSAGAGRGMTFTATF